MNVLEMNLIIVKMPITPTAPDGKLSTPSKIGITVGVSLGSLITLISAVVLALRRRRKTMEIRKVESNEKPELDAEPAKKERFAAEVESGEVHEMSAMETPVEADGPNNLVELEAKHGVSELLGNERPVR